MAEPPSLEKAAWLEDPRLQRAMDALEAAGGEVRVAGGAVRNALLGQPICDVDLATTLPPESVMRAAAKAGLGVHPTGLKHGTVLVTVDGRPFEVTTLRVDVETDGRHAKVAFTRDWAADARRRDLTINALYCDRRGKTYDYVGGYSDILRKRIRFVGDPAQRITEDYLRILRFFRFVARLEGWDADQEGLAACVALRQGLARLSAERVREEMFKLIVAPGAAAALQLMIVHGVAEAAAPELGTRSELEERLALFERMVAVDRAQDLAPDPLLRLDLLAGDGLALSQRLRFTNEEKGRLMRAHDGPPPTPTLREPERRIVLYHKGERAWRDAVRLAWARNGGDAHDPGWASLLRFPESWAAPSLPITGSDLVRHGHSPGRSLGATLARLEDWWVAGDFSAGKDELIARAAEFRATAEESE